MKSFICSILLLLLSGCVKNIPTYRASMEISESTPADRGTIDGLVYEDDGKTPIPGVMVWAYDKYGFLVSCARADMHGKYTISNITAGEYILQIRSDEFYGTRGRYAGEYYKNAYTPQNANIVSVSPGRTTKNIHFLLSKGGAIKGKIIGIYCNMSTPVTFPPEAVQPLAETPIFLKAYKSKNLSILYFSNTDSAGNYTITGLEPGEYSKFIIEPEGWVGGMTSDAIICEDTVFGINLETMQGGAISGHVTPQEPVKIQVIGLNKALEKQVDSIGFYLISGLPEGNYIVKAVPSPESQCAWQYWASEGFRDRIAPSSATPVSVTGTDTTRGIDFQLADEGVISGSVKDEKGNPIEDFEIKLYTLEGEKLPQDFGFRISDGVYKIDGVPEGKYILKINSFSPRTLKAYQSSYYNRSDTPSRVTAFKRACPVEVKSSYNTSGVDFKLKEGCIIQGFLLLNNYLVSSDSIRFTVLALNTQTDAVFVGKHTFIGGYRITGLPSGEYKLCALAQDEDFSVVWLGGGRSFNYTKTETIKLKYPIEEVNFSIVPGNLEISGKVCNTQNQPVLPTPETQIVAYDSMGYIVQIGKYTEKGYTIKGLPSGRYFLKTCKFKESKNMWYKTVGADFICDIDKSPYISKIPVKAEFIELIDKSVSNVDFRLQEK